MNFRRWTLLLLFLVFHFAVVAKAQNVAPVAEKICELKDARINESSGLAASRKYSASELLITHNDSGGEPKLFYVNLHGETVAEVLLKGATNIDWEDMAITDDWIYVGDIGDNMRKRESVTIYRLREPEFNPRKTGQKREATCEKMTLKYPDAPCDSETLMATRNGEIILISKNGGPSRFYKTPRAFENNATQTLEKIGEYSFTGKTASSYLTTGGDLSPSGMSFIVRTYTHAYAWSLLDETWKRAIKDTPYIWELPTSKQGEAICFAADSSAYFLSSEGAPAPIWKIKFDKSIKKSIARAFAKR